MLLVDRFTPAITNSNTIAALFLSGDSFHLSVSSCLLNCHVDTGTVPYRIKPYPWHHQTETKKTSKQTGSHCKCYFTQFLDSFPQITARLVATRLISDLEDQVCLNSRSLHRHQPLSPDGLYSADVREDDNINAASSPLACSLLHQKAHTARSHRKKATTDCLTNTKARQFVEGPPSPHTRTRPNAPTHLPR